MPTAKPRLNLTLEPQMASLIERASIAREVPRSRVITDLLEAVAPQLERMVEMVEAANRAPASVHEQLRTALARAHDQLAPMTEAVETTSDHLQIDIEAVIAAAVAASKNGVAPVPSSSSEPSPDL